MVVFQLIMPARKKVKNTLLLTLAFLLLLLLNQYGTFYWRVNNNLAITATNRLQDYAVYLFKWFRFERLTPDEVNAYYMKWSPDGREIAYSYRYKENDIHDYIAILNIDNKDVLTTIKLEDLSSFAWAPDGASLLVVASNEVGINNLYLYDRGTGALSSMKMNFAGVAFLDWEIGNFPLVRECVQEQTATRCSIYILRNNLSTKEYITDGDGVSWIDKDKFVVSRYYDDNVNLTLIFFTSDGEIVKQATADLEISSADLGRDYLVYFTYTRDNLPGEITFYNLCSQKKISFQDRTSREFVAIRVFLKPMTMPASCFQ